jgi:hypothetical protein
MEIQDSVRLFVDIKNAVKTGYDYTPVLTVVISGIFSIVLAWLTSKLTRKKELDQIRDENRKLDGDIKHALLAIETETYRKLYELKLVALKEIKKISFEHLERNPNNYSSMHEFLQCFPFYEIEKLIHNYILEYSYIFPIGITSLLKEIHRDSEFVLNNMVSGAPDPDDYAQSIYENFRNLIILIENDMNIDFVSIEKKIK